jgi:2-haloacid dehalogenase
MARRNGDDPPPPGHELRQRWEELQFARIQDEYRGYREVLSDSLSEWAGERGYRWNERDGEALARSMESWQPFPDTVPALRQARQAGLRLWIVSNTDRAIIEHTLRQLSGIEFDGVTVAEDVSAYKPAHQPFQRALEELAEDPGRVVHTAFGFKYDIGPARALGFRTAWVNRKREQRPGPAQPDHEWDSLWPLAELAAAP